MEIIKGLLILCVIKLNTGNQKNTKIHQVSSADACRTERDVHLIGRKCLAVELDGHKPSLLLYTSYN